MRGTKKQKIRWEIIERLVLPNTFQRFCPVCQFEQIFVSTEQATLLTELTMRGIFRLVEIEALHFFETREGFLFICEDSLNLLSRQSSFLEIPQKEGGAFFQPEDNTSPQFLLKEQNNEK